MVGDIGGLQSSAHFLRFTKSIVTGRAKHTSSDDNLSLNGQYIVF